jgi:hypothetical protein
MADELDDLASFFDDEKKGDNDQEDSDDDLLASFFEDEEDTTDNDEADNDDLLASFFGPDPEEEAPEPVVVSEEGDNDDLLASFFESDDDAAPETETQEHEEEDILASFFDDEAVQATDTEEEEEEDADIGSIFGELLGSSNQKPDPLFPYKKEKRKARLDITKNSKGDHRNIKRYTKSELNDQLKRDYKYMLSKPYMMIQPVTIMADYPYKKKKSDDDEVRSYNTEYDYVLVIGKLLKWRSTEEFKGKPYKLGEIMYVKRGIYWVNGKEISMEPHFAIVLHRSYKRIKSKRIRDMLAPLKQRLRSGKPFTIYKDFPIIVKRTGAYS